MLTNINAISSCRAKVRGQDRVDLIKSGSLRASCELRRAEGCRNSRGRTGNYSQNRKIIDLWYRRGRGRKAFGGI
jgi:hypothetical protein